MTSDSHETSNRHQPETFRSHLPAIVAATVGTVFAAVLGSLMGTAGTVAGMALGSLASGTFSWWTERGIRRSAAIAHARATAIRARGRPLSPEEDAAVTRVIAARHDRARGHWRWAVRDRRWAVPAAVVAAAFVGCAITVTVLETAAGKPLSAVVRDEPGHGTTLGGGHTGTDPARPAPTPSASRIGHAATAPASSATPSRASGSPTVSPTPAVTTHGSARPSPSTLPTAAPTVSVPSPISSSARPTGG